MLNTEIGFPIFSRFFLVTSQSGVKAQTITIDGARERPISQSRALIECPVSSWTFRYTNGYSITLRGPFSAEVVVAPIQTPNSPTSRTSTGAALDYTLKVDRLQFDAFYHDKYLAYDMIRGERIPESPRIAPSPNGAAAANGAGGEQDPTRVEEPRYFIEHASIPAEPINAFGIPQATMRCLEVSNIVRCVPYVQGADAARTQQLAESVAQMTELIQFSAKNHLGPVGAL